MATKGSALGLALLVLTLVSFTDWMWKESLWSESIRLQEFMQLEWPGVYSAMSLLSSSSLLITLAPQCLFFYFDDPLTGAHLSLFTFLASGGSGLLKMLYSDPRPFWVSDAVKGLACEQDWGTPSGHALFTSTVWGAVAVSLARKGYKSSIPLILLWLVLIGFSRLYLGVHFLSQVVLGWAWGAMLTAVYSNLPRTNIEKKEYVAWLGSVTVLGTTAVLASYKDYVWDEAWSLRIAHSCLFTSTSPQIKGLLETCLLAWLLGLLLIAYSSQSSSAYLSLSSHSYPRKSLLCVLSLVPILVAVGTGKH